MTVALRSVRVPSLATVVLLMATGLARAEAPAPGAEFASAPAVVAPLSEAARQGAPQIFARMPDCVKLAADGAPFRAEINRICRAVASRVTAGTAENVVDLFAAIQLRHYHEAVGRLAADRTARSPRRRPNPGEASAYLIARELKLFAIHKAMFGAPQRTASPAATASPS